MNKFTDESVFKEFLLSARQVCREIEELDLGKTQSLLSALIWLLYNADKLAHISIEFLDDDPNLETTLPNSLSSIPNGLVFQVVFDPLNPNSLCAASLKDSLGDIYQSLKSGIEMLDKNPKSRIAVFGQWRLEYQTHWGRHLIDVVRFLFLCK